MEKFQYNSYPDSTESSPRSREIDFDNPPPWDDQNNQNHQQSYKVKFMCSYGGKIQPRPHDNQLTYVNGETKILSVDRSIRFSVLASKLAAVTNGDNVGGGGEVTFKYQLPGEDLDALISVTNDDDLEHMMHEYDRLVRMSSKPARMRLFLFPVTNSGFGSQGSTQSDRDRFVDALNNTVPSKLNESEKSVVPPPNSDFLFGSNNKIVPPPSQPLPVDVKLPVPVVIEPPLFNDPRLIQPDPVEIQRQMHEFQRLQIRDQEQQQLLQHQNQNQQEGMYRRKNNDDGGYFPTPYAQNPVMQPPQATIPQTSPQGFWQGNHNTPGGGGVFPTQGLGLHEQQQQPPVYMIPTPTPSPASVYHAPPHPQGVMRPQGNQGGYYPPIQRMAQDVYREQHQPAYNMAQSQTQVQPVIGTKVVQPPPPTAFTSGPPPPQYSAVPQPRQVVGLPDSSGYTPQVAYPGGMMGKQQVYYTEAPPPPQIQPYHGIGLPVSGGMSELRTGPDGKLVATNIAPKVSSQNSDSAV